MASAVGAALLPKAPACFKMPAGVIGMEAISRESLREAFLQASRDPLFLEDIAEIEHDFRSADAETAAMIVCEECGED